MKYSLVVSFDLRCQSGSISVPKQPSCEKRCGPPIKARVESCEIKGGGQEMAAMVPIPIVVMITV